MNYIRALGLLLLFAGVFQVSPARAQIGLVEMDNPVHTAPWNRRVLAVCAVAGAEIDAPLMQRQYDAAPWGAMLERDLMLVWIAPEEIFSWTPLPDSYADVSIALSLTDTDPTDLRKRSACTGTKEFVVLIGKDGGVKRKWEGFVPYDDVFGAIDAMPMRRQEIRERSVK